jgi:hypothetical protein
VPIVIRSVTAAIPPSVAHTNGLWPCRSVHGWKWSEIAAKSNPTRSADRASSIRPDGPRSSLQSLYPKCMPTF